MGATVFGKNGRPHTPHPKNFLIILSEINTARADRKSVRAVSIYFYLKCFRKGTQGKHLSLERVIPAKKYYSPKINSSTSAREGKVKSGLSLAEARATSSAVVSPERTRTLVTPWRLPSAISV